VQAAKSHAQEANQQAASQPLSASQPASWLADWGALFLAPAGPPLHCSSSLPYEQSAMHEGLTHYPETCCPPSQWLAGSSQATCQVLGQVLAGRQLASEWEEGAAIDAS